MTVHSGTTVMQNKDHACMLPQEQLEYIRNLAKEYLQHTKYL